MADTSLLAFAGLALVLVITPGANIMLVIRSVLGKGPRAGIATAIGVAFGHFVHASASALGLSLFLQTSEAAFTTIKVAGAIYLTYLGVRSLLSAWRARGGAFDVVDGSVASEPLRRPDAARALWRFMLDGFWCNVLNPKVAIFYLALLPQFVRPGDAVLPRSLLLAGVHACISISWQSILSLALGTIRPVLARPVVYRTLEALTGSLLIGFGIRLALARA